MIVCPVCHHENADAANLCGNCYAPLGKSLADEESTRSVKINSVPKRSHVHYLGILPWRSLALFISGSQEPLIVDISSHAVLGRYMPDKRQQPRIDLVPYGAGAKGVSRLHMIIRATDTGFVAEDLGSRNGTWLNGIPLMPHISTPLKSGDQLLLGKLEIEVLFRQPEEA